MLNKGFIFDWSGTLSDNFHLFCQVCALVFKDLGKDPITSEEIRQNFTLPYMKFWNKYLPDLTKEKQCILYEKYIHEVGDPNLYPNVKDVIAELYTTGYMIFIVSSDPLSKLLPEIEDSGLKKYITKIEGGVHEKAGTIKNIVRDYSLDQNHSYYVGDTSGDVEAGKDAGVKTIGITWGFQNKKLITEAHPDHIINDIIEISRVSN